MQDRHLEHFTEPPRICSQRERPAFELHYPGYVERFRNEAHVRHDPRPDANDVAGHR